MHWKRRYTDDKVLADGGEIESESDRNSLRRSIEQTGEMQGQCLKQEMSVVFGMLLSITVKQAVGRERRKRKKISQCRLKTTDRHDPDDTDCIRITEFGK